MGVRTTGGGGGPTPYDVNAWVHQATGRYHLWLPEPNAFALFTNFALTGDTIYGLLRPFPRAITIPALYIYVTTQAAAAEVMGAAIYAVTSDTDMTPAARLIAKESVAIDSTGAKTFTFASPLEVEAGTILVAALNPSANVSIVGSQVYGAGSVLGRSADDIANLRYAAMGWNKASAYVDTMPDPFPASPSYWTPGASNAPAIFMTGW